MEPEKKETVVEVNEDAELDKELDATLSSIKAGNETEVKKEETPAKPAEEGASKPQESDIANKDEYEFRVPNKGKFESDESYEKRIELMDLVKRRKLAKTEEQKAEISAEIKTTKSQIKNLNGTDKIINPLNQSVATIKEEEEDEATKADRERLKQLGGATKEDIQDILKQERMTADVTSTLEKFVERHSELKDEDVREVFFDFIENNYNYQGKGGKELMTVLELAHESMFKPSETIQERVLKGANVQEKVNAMQFPGGTISKGAMSPEMRKDLDELKATGMSEEKALELLAD
jgi:hypothetical protein